MLVFLSPGLLLHGWPPGPRWTHLARAAPFHARNGRALSILTARGGGLLSDLGGAWPRIASPLFLETCKMYAQALMSHRPTPSCPYEAGDAARGEILVVAATHHSGRACGGLQPTRRPGGITYFRHIKPIVFLPISLARPVPVGDQVDPGDDVDDPPAVARTPVLPARSKRYASSRWTSTSSCGSGLAMISPTCTGSGRGCREEAGQRHFLDAAHRLAVVRTGSCEMPLDCISSTASATVASGLDRHQRSAARGSAAGRRSSGAAGSATRMVLGHPVVVERICSGSSGRCRGRVTTTMSSAPRRRA